MISIELGGFDDLERQIKEAQAALESLGPELTLVKCNPSESRDVERAIAEMETAVDAKLARFRSNPFIEPLINASKQSFREQILKLAEEERQKAPGFSALGIYFGLL